MIFRHAMKKAIVPLFSLLLLSSAVHSQAVWVLIFGESITSKISPKFDMGVQLGLNESFIINSSAKRFLPSFAFGTYINYRFHEKWNLNTFITFKSNRGAQKLDSADGFLVLPNDSLESISLRRKFTYMDFSPEIQYIISPSFAIGIGPVISLLVKARDTYEAKENGAKVTYEYNTYKRINALDIGAAIDFQYTFGKGKGVKLNVKYMQGFIAAYKTTRDGTYLNAVVNIGVGIPTRIFSKKSNPDEKENQ